MPPEFFSRPVRGWPFNIVNPRNCFPRRAFSVRTVRPNLPGRGRHSGGTGLGLAIVAALMAAHGGEVQVDSQVGLGTTFRCVFPLLPTGNGTGDPVPAETG